MFSLITDPWLPVIYSDGRRSKITPEQITDSSIIELDYPRADFQGAAYQFLIGLLQTSFAPEDQADWDDYWSTPPTLSLLQQALYQLKPAMNFSAEKPAFMQDFESLQSEPTPIAGLLIDAPGANALKLNKDHFVKRDNVTCLCQHCAAMALFTLQTNAPSGGQGHRTSMRGGGPMTTLVMPNITSQTSLWQKLWLNVYPQASVNHCFDASVFPWLAATKTSEQPNNIITPEISHDLQAYWGIPRRIELDFTETQSGACDLCGATDQQLLTQYRTKNYGVQYDGWQHPLSPYRQGVKEGAPLLSVKGQPGGLTYKDWLGLMSTNHDQSNNYFPAKVVRLHSQRPKAVRQQTGLWCFGYDMDNMKARCWYQHHFPLIVLSDPQQIEQFNALITLGLELATSSLSLLRSTISEAKGESSLISLAYWQETEPAFLTFVNGIYQAMTTEPSDQKKVLIQWRNSLRDYVFTIFIERVLNDPDNTVSIEKKAKIYQSLRRQFFKQKPLKMVNELAGITKETNDVE